MDASREDPAEDYARKIVQGIEVYRKNVSAMNTLKMTGLALLVLLAQFGLIKGVSHLFRGVIFTP